MTVVVPLSAFLITISVLDLSSLSILRSTKGRLFRSFNTSMSASWTLTSSKWVSNVMVELEAPSLSWREKGVVY